MDDDVRFNEQVAAVRASGVLGRAGRLPQLFDFLCACAQAGRVPKELEIATDAFGRDAGFDASQDAAVRVYVHKLRRKLDEFYAGPGRGAVQRLALPKGEYRLVLQAAALGPTADAPGALEVEALEGSAAAVWPSRRRWLGTALAGSLGLNVVLGAGWGLSGWSNRDAGLTSVRGSPLWAPLLEGDRPVVIVVGDYFLLGESGPALNVQRLVREFAINSHDDLARFDAAHPERAGQYLDLDLSYLPLAAAGALREVVPIVALPSKRLRVIPLSQLSGEMLNIGHVIYIGWLSGLGRLQSLVFSGSGFTVGQTYDELVDAATNKRYVGGSAGARAPQEKQRDVSYISSFAGPAGNRFIILTGTRDLGTLHAASRVSRRESLAALEKARGSQAAFEAVYSAFSLNRTLVDATLEVVRPLDATRIWRNP